MGSTSPQAGAAVSIVWPASLGARPSLDSSWWSRCSCAAPSALAPASACPAPGRCRYNGRRPASEQRVTIATDGRRLRRHATRSRSTCTARAARARRNSATCPAPAVTAISVNLSDAATTASRSTRRSRRPSAALRPRRATTRSAAAAATTCSSAARERHADRQRRRRHRPTYLEQLRRAAACHVDLAGRHGHGGRRQSTRVDPSIENVARDDRSTDTFTAQRGRASQFTAARRTIHDAVDAAADRGVAHTIRSRPDRSDTSFGNSSTSDSRRRPPRASSFDDDTTPEHDASRRGPPDITDTRTRHLRRWSPPRPR